MIDENRLGICESCGGKVTYDISKVPYCEKCGMTVKAALCYLCGETDEIYFKENADGDDVFPFCVSCDDLREDVYFDGSDCNTSPRFAARLGRILCGNPYADDYPPIYYKVGKWYWRTMNFFYRLRKNSHNDFEDNIPF